MRAIISAEKLPGELSARRRGLTAGLAERATVAAGRRAIKLVRTGAGAVLAALMLMAAVPAPGFLAVPSSLGAAIARIPSTGA